MSIIRTRMSFERDFTMIPNSWVRDDRLTLKARGLLAQVLSHSEGWEITIESLARVNPEGRDSLRAAIKELEDHGYLTRKRARGDHGKFGGMDYHLSEPGTDFPTQAEPYVGETRDKEDHSFTEDQSQEQCAADADAPLALIEEVKAPTTDQDFEEFWKAYEAPAKGVKKKAATVYKSARKHHTAGDLMDKLETYKKHKARERAKGWTSNPPHAERWLRDERWNDYTEATMPATTTISLSWADAL